MSSVSAPVPAAGARLADLVERLNHTCHCVSLDRGALDTALARDLDDRELVERLGTSHPHLFAPFPVFVGADDVAALRRVVEAVARVVAAPESRRELLAEKPTIAHRDPGARGVFYGFDVHLAAEGPRLIEINTNAGGALLGLYLARAQRACCQPVARFTTGALDLDGFEDELVGMFRREHELGGPGGRLERVAIVDQRPAEQFLHPELLLFQRLFRRAGIDAMVAGPEELEVRDDRLQARGAPVDLVYNRLTDFYLEGAEVRALAEAYERRLVTVTPHPHGYALWADKRNLVLLSDPERLRRLGVDGEAVDVLASCVPETFDPAARVASAADAAAAEDLWRRRKELFFKPATGFGSRGAYDGAKLTRRVFAEITATPGRYLAQRKVPPSERFTIVDGREQSLKVDVRAVVYDATIQLLTARLYRGQTTNLRTEGGGLATVFVAPPR